MARITVLVIAAISVFLARNPDSSVFRIVSFAWAGFGANFRCCYALCTVLETFQPKRCPGRNDRRWSHGIYLEIPDRTTRRTPWYLRTAACIPVLRSCHRNRQPVDRSAVTGDHR